MNGDGGDNFSAAFIAFYQERYPATVRLAVLLSGSNEVGEDVTQEAFVAVAARYQRIEMPAAYLRRTVVNLANNHHCQRQRRRERLRLLTDPEPAAPGFEAVELGQLISLLPFRQRVVVVGRYWAGWSEAQLAELLGCRRGTVKSLASRALTALRSQIGADHR